MPFYRYKAYNQEGKEVSAVIEAVSISHLKKILTLKGLIPYEIEEISSIKKTKRSFFQIEIFLQKKVSKEELTLLLYEIGILLERNVHITQIFDILSKQIENPVLKDALLSAKEYVQQGSSIADAFDKTAIFPKFLIEMIRAGETSGALDTVFLSASEFIEKQEEFKRKIVNALIYPIVVIIVAFISVVIIMNFVVPTITKIYTQFGKELPTLTKIIVHISSVTSLFIKISPLILIFGILSYKKLATREIVDKLKLKLPFFRKVHLYTIYLTWSNTLSFLLKGGLTLDKAIKIANETINNVVLKKQFNTVADEITKGKSLSDLLNKYSLFPENSIQLIKIGEETGQLENMLGVISQIYRKQTDRLLTIFLSYLEPVVLILLSIVIGFFVFATLLPIFSLNVK
ncbi:MAG TPA: type II secretion system F family protein [Persephonella sp.]|nr:type II secretion system F family protein [Persephonella sp.]